MLDIRLIRSETDRVRAALARRGADAALDEVIGLDGDARAVRQRVETTRAERTLISKRVGEARKAGRDSSAEEEAARALGEALTTDEGILASLEARRDELMLGLPNLGEDAPQGGEDDAVELRKVGEPPAFGFTARDHVELGVGVGGLNIEQATKISGARFAYITGALARVQLALVSFTIDLLDQRGFTPVIPPVMVREEAMYGTGFFPTDRQSIYRLADDDLYLVGTSEVPLAGLHMGHVMAEGDVPARYAGTSTCFRREAGAAGKDTRGIFRVHQFEKVEMFSFVLPEESDAEHLRLLAMQEEILQALGLVYRVVDIALGDLGASAARKFDCEAWMAGQGRYREVTSSSNCTDYQARRLNCRVKRGKSTEMVHTLNGTAMALGRTIIAILETHQREDGSVAIPEVLHGFGAPRELVPR